MTDAARVHRVFGDGPLSRFAAFVYTLLAVEGMLLLATAPGLAALVLLARDAANLPLFALCAVPVGPALSAALVTLNRPRDITDLHPAAVFGRAWLANLRAVLAVWVPLLAGLTVIATSLAHRAAAGVPGWWAVLLLVIAAAGVLWAVDALLLVSFFQFRTRDVARLAAYFLLAAPGVTVATACLLVVATGVVLAASELGLALLGSLLALLLLNAHRPLLDRTRREFVA